MTATSRRWAIRCTSVGACLVAVILIAIQATSSAAEPGRAVRLLQVDRMASGHPAVVAYDGGLALQEGSLVQPWDFTGINAYQLTSRWGVNNGCGWGGWSPASLEQFFSSLPANALVRTWFFQADATQVVDGRAQRNWTALDQLIAAANDHDVHLVLTLGNEDGTCDDNTWKGPGWYGGGYLSAVQTGSPPGPGNTSYATWVHDAVGRYGSEPAVAMWEPINEPQAASCSITPGWDCWGTQTCVSEEAASQALVSFYTAVGREIHELAPGKLVSDGSFAGDGCGTQTGADFRRAISSPGVDVVGYHDYSGVVSPPDLAGRIADAKALGKPTMIGEAGVTGCASAQQRATIYRQKIKLSQREGAAAFLAWWYDNDGGVPTCSSPIYTDSPTWPAIMDTSRPNGFLASA